MNESKHDLGIPFKFKDIFFTIIINKFVIKYELSAYINFYRKSNRSHPQHVCMILLLIPTINFRDKEKFYFLIV